MISLLFFSFYYLIFDVPIDIKAELERATAELIEFYYERTQREKEKLLEEAKRRMELKEKESFRKKLEVYCREKKINKPVFTFVGNEHSMKFLFRFLTFLLRLFIFN